MNVAGYESRSKDTWKRILQTRQEGHLVLVMKIKFTKEIRSHLIVRKKEGKTETVSYHNDRQL